MRTKQIFFLGLALLGVGSLTAQNAIQREVNVTREYEPSVQNALKLNIMPDMADTTLMRPEFHYEITPRPLNYGFAVNPLAPARMSTVSEAAPLPFYAKLGVGYSPRSAADIRYSKALGERAHFGAFATHSGRWDNIENDMAVKENAAATDNSVGTFLDFRPDEALFFKLDLGYDFRHVNRYGYFRHTPSAMPFETSDDFMLQHFQNLKAKFSFGTLHQRLNFRLSGGIDYFMDRFQYNQQRISIDGAFDFRVGEYGAVTVGFDARLTKGSHNLKGHENRIAGLEVAYDYEHDGLRFRLGAGFGSSETVPGQNPDSSQFVFLPRVVIEKDLAGGRFTPFVEVQGSITDNSYGELARRNPYLYSGQCAQNTINYNSRAGAKGTLGRMFKYVVYGGYTMQKEAAFWANAYSGYDSPTNAAAHPFYGNEGNVFTVLTDDLNYFEAGIDYQLNIRSALTWRGALNYRSHSPDTFDKAWGMPELTVSTDVAYNHRDRLYLNAGLEHTGERQMYSLYAAGVANAVAAQTNLKFSVDYFLNKRFGLFLQLDNLLNQDIYRFNRYREPGIGGTAGIKISF